MKKGPKPRSAEERFWRNVSKQDNGCWLWKGALFGNRYGQLQGDDGRMIVAHRFSYRLHGGEIPVGMFINHKCDVRNCVNPDHLYVGTHEENNRDRVERGRTRSGPRKATATSGLALRSENRHGRALSVSLRRKLIDEYHSGKFNQAELAKRYRVCQATISATIRGARNMGAGGDGKKRSGNYRRKFSPEQVAAILADYRSGMTQQQVAEKHGCDQTYVSLLSKRLA